MLVVPHTTLPMPPHPSWSRSEPVRLCLTTWAVAFDPEEEQKCSIPVGCALEDVPHDRFHKPEDRKRCVRLPRWREVLANAVVPPVVSCRLPEKAAQMLPSAAHV